MRLDGVNLLLSLVGILLSVLLAVASLFVAGIVIGMVLGVAASPYVARGSARLARHLGHSDPAAASPSHTLVDTSKRIR